MPLQRSRSGAGFIGRCFGACLVANLALPRAAVAGVPVDTLLVRATRAFSVADPAARRHALE